MPRIGTICAICLVLHLLTPVQANSSPAWPVQVPFRPGTVLVGARPGESLARTARWLADHSLQVESDLTPLPVVSVNVPTGQEMATVESLRRTGQVAFAELDYRARATDVITPNDPGWPSQWGPAKIQAPSAWSLVTGTQVTIAVVDSGIQLLHEDLASQVWTNPGEIPGNGLDDDGNGKIDDIHGWHFYRLHGMAARFIPQKTLTFRMTMGTARMSPASPPPPPTTASGSPAWRAARPSCRSKCSTSTAMVGTATLPPRLFTPPTTARTLST